MERKDPWTPAPASSLGAAPLLHIWLLLLRTPPEIGPWGFLWPWLHPFPFRIVGSRSIHCRYLSSYLHFC